MKNYLNKTLTIQNFAKAIILGVVFMILISVNLKSGFNGAGSIFHEGEMMGSYWHILKYYGGTDVFPVFIHGAMDYWPSLVAGYIFGDEKIIYGTRLTVVLFTSVSWIIFSLILIVQYLKIISRP